MDECVVVDKRTDRTGRIVFEDDAVRLEQHDTDTTHTTPYDAITDITVSQSRNKRYEVLLGVVVLPCLFFVYTGMMVAAMANLYPDYLCVAIIAGAMSLGFYLWYRLPNVTVDHVCLTTRGDATLEFNVPNGLGESVVQTVMEYRTVEMSTEQHDRTFGSDQTLDYV